MLRGYGDAHGQANMIAFWCTFGSIALLVGGGISYLSLSLKASIRQNGREVVSALKHDSTDLVRLRAEFEQLRTLVSTETSITQRLVEERRHLRSA